MKTTIKLLSVAVLFTASFSTSCKKDKTDSGSTEIAFSLSADNSIANLTAVVEKGATISGTPTLNWSSAIANIASFKLEAKRANQQIEITSKNLINVDLFALTPSLSSAAIDTGSYKEIEVKVMLQKTTSTNLPLTLKGTYTTAAGAAIPVQLDFNDDAIIKIEAENVVVDGSKDIRAILALHLNKLFTGITAQQIDSATRTNNTVVISSTSNSTLYNKIKLNILTCAGSKGFEKHDKSERGK